MSSSSASNGSSTTLDDPGAKTRRVLWTESAAVDLESIVASIRRDDVKIAKKWLERIRARAAALKRLPFRGRIVPELLDHGISGYRELVVAPWRIIYRVTEESVLVFAIIDGRRSVEDVLLDRLVRRD